MSSAPCAISPTQRFLKRSFDIVASGLGLVVLWPVILLAWVVAAIDTRANGFFTQERVGRNLVPFKVIKIRTMRAGASDATTVTTADDPRITTSGLWLRRWKVDELPQLINVLKGDMSLVGPRPDAPGFLDQLQGDDRIIQSLRPGITGPASIKYADEEALLAAQEAPEDYNQNVIWPDKVRINREYVLGYRISVDIRLVFATILRAAGPPGRREPAPPSATHGANHPPRNGDRS